MVTGMCSFRRGRQVEWDERPTPPEESWEGLSAQSTEFESKKQTSRKGVGAR